MEFHIQCNPEEISRYIFCPGDHVRAKKIADFFDDSRLVTESRGYAVFSGTYNGVFMTSCGTGMGGPTVAIALTELANMGANAFIRVGSCGVFQEGQKSGDVIISSGTVRAGGTSNAYLPPMFPAVPTFEVLHQIVHSAESLDIPYTVGVGIAGDAFYGPRDPNSRQRLIDAGIVSVEMESDTLYIMGMYHGWRTGALYASDGTPDEIKPEAGEKDFRTGEQNVIRIALDAMAKIAEGDGSS